jgi:hypothetical protein
VALLLGGRDPLVLNLSDAVVLIVIRRDRGLVPSGRSVDKSEHVIRAANESGRRDRIKPEF